MARVHGGHPSRFQRVRCALGSDRPGALPPPSEVAWMANTSARKMAEGGRQSHLPVARETRQKRTGKETTLPPIGGLTDRGRSWLVAAAKQFGMPNE